MRPEALAALHAAAFAPARGWSAAEFDSFLADPACLLVARPEGFALARVTLDEAELLTIATDPARRRQGVARGLLGALFGGLAGRGAETLFLEVAEDNAAARALYAGAGFAMAGRRRGYYPRRDGAAADALILRRALG
ncbi:MULTISPECIES: GNAT family N-acetyltransferase [Marinovum]|uniref:GNAT family N-acetyltransferase n=1 Tax=Marinovum TaxID=367771 RepID=UPI00237BC4D8|nr:MULTISPECIES: GNAT family N-acetyltransferase [Marinovum]MDD9741449.1 GNAT family N-acetyltransferase [Marinovum sp. SP66]MDD9743856.1 GNAT family N-acetyltransferase [Marinovum sp. PR37]